MKVKRIDLRDFIEKIDWQIQFFSLTFIAICYGLGVLSYFILDIEFYIKSLLLFWLLLGIFLHLLFYKLRTLCLPIVIFALGFSCAFMHSHWQKLGYEHYDNDRVFTISGQVLEASDGLRYSKVIIENEAGAHWQLRLQEKDAPLPGTTIRLLVKPLLSEREFFQFYHFYKNIAGYAISLSETTILDNGDDKGGFDIFIAKLRLKIARMFDAKPDPDAVMHQDAAGVARAILVGMRGMIDKDALTAMRHAGLGHLLAISGLHFGIFAFGVFWFVRFILAGFPMIAERYHIKKFAACLAIFSGFLYLLLSGGAVSAARAFIMMVCVCSAVLWDMRAFSLNLLAVAFIILLSISPHYILQPGFQMSFMAVLGLIALFDYLRDSRYYRLPKFFRWLLGIALTTLIAGVAVAPFTLWHFNYFSNYSILANLLALPLMMFWVMPSAVVTLCLMPFGLHDSAMQFMFTGIDYIIAIAVYVAELSGSVSYIVPPSLPATLLLLFGLMSIALLWRHQLALIVGTFASLAGMILIITAPQPILILTGWHYGFFDNDSSQYIFTHNLPRGNKRREINSYLRDSPIKINGKKGFIASNYQCGDLLCEIESEGLRILVTRKPEGVLLMCAEHADILVSIYDMPILCSHKHDSLKISGSQMRRGAFVFANRFGAPNIHYFFGDKPPSPELSPFLSAFATNKRLWQY
ncbi:MAG: ComEC/Rec2 family competence protein [Alphaproteobacteria bacterium]|nr:ComEC/Rec2 family competence protein [Alphaproteobacteria bacterium]